MSQSRSPFKDLTKKFRHSLEYAGFWLICRIFRSLGIRKADQFAAFLGRNLGPLFPVHHVADRNLKTVLPSYPPEQRRHILKAMWAHWAQTCAEYCFLDKPGDFDIEIQGQEILQRAVAQGKGVVIFSGHFGNFQLIAWAAGQIGCPVTQIYRQANNPWIDRDMQNLQKAVCGRVVAKNDKAGKIFLEAVRLKEPVFLLIDQKFAQGSVLNFMGHPAYTVTTPARLCQRFNSLFIPARCQRLSDQKFRVTFYESLSLEGSSEDVMDRANTLLEQWILETPEQWFWVHKRWVFSSIPHKCLQL